ncbi:MAG: hypothetical protein V4472_24165 [Pseudomonadota bacterium]
MAFLSGAREVVWMSWYMIRLDLARTRAFPEGSRAHYLVLRVPLDPLQIVDADAVRSAPARATVVRSQPDQPETHGYLIPKAGGWVFSGGGRGGGEPLFHVEAHPLRVGEFVTVTEPDGAALTYEITSCEALELA